MSKATRPLCPICGDRTMTENSATCGRPCGMILKAQRTGRAHYPIPWRECGCGSWYIQRWHKERRCGPDCFVCSDCLKQLPKDAFAIDRSKASGVKHRCRECQRLRERNWRTTNPEPRRAAVRRHRATQPEQAKRLSRYGLTVNEGSAMVTAQGGLCAICRKRPVDLNAGMTTHVDHDHVTGMVRALLCRNCNLVLGYSSDDPSILRAAAEFIEAPERWWSNRR